MAAPHHQRMRFVHNPEKVMQKITKEEFKAQARRQHQSLLDRNIPAKLSDVQESLAVSLGYRNLAHFYGTLVEEVNSKVPRAQVESWSRWVMVMRFVDEVTGNDTDFGVEEWMLLPEGTTLDDVAVRARNKEAQSRWFAVARFEELVLSDKTTVLETYVELPSIAKYGLTPPSDENQVDGWVVEELGFRVPVEGVKVSRRDMRDDGADIVALEIAVTDADAALIREKMF
jgi:hypothetical protein